MEEGGREGGREGGGEREGGREGGMREGRVRKREGWRDEEKRKGGREDRGNKLPRLFLTSSFHHI